MQELAVGVEDGHRAIRVRPRSTKPSAETICSGQVRCDREANGSIALVELEHSSGDRIGGETTTSITGQVSIAIATAIRGRRGEDVLASRGRLSRELPVSAPKRRSASVKLRHRRLLGVAGENLEYG